CTCISFFFFQAEDGIRDRNVTGVQTCALPISAVIGQKQPRVARGQTTDRSPPAPPVDQQVAVIVDPEKTQSAENARPPAPVCARSEERRVGKESGRVWGRED